MLKDRVRKVLEYVLIGCGNDTFCENYYLDIKSDQFLPEDEFFRNPEVDRPAYSFMINKDLVNEKLRSIRTVKPIEKEDLGRIATELVS